MWNSARIELCQAQFIRQHSETCCLANLLSPTHGLSRSHPAIGPARSVFLGPPGLGSSSSPLVPSVKRECQFSTAHHKRVAKFGLDLLGREYCKRNGTHRRRLLELAHRVSDTCQILSRRLSSAGLSRRQSQDSRLSIPRVALSGCDQGIPQS